MNDEQITINEQLFHTDDGTDEVLTEAIKKLIPASLRAKLSSRKSRQLMLEKYGKNAFLLPDQLKFPVVNPETGKIDCGLLYAARIRAKQYAGVKSGYREVAARAEKMFKANSCSTKLNVQIHDNANEAYDIDLAALVEILY